MLDDLFPFIDPIIGLGDDDIAHMVIRADLFFDFLEENGIEKPAGLPESQEIPLAVAISLLKPNELEKLKKYIAAYMAKHGND
jgi:hypothetical protein